MKISELLSGGRPTVSCELFPPKLGETLEHVAPLLADIAALHPDFVSVTYGAGGSTARHTKDIAASLQRVHHVPALAHLTCVTATRQQIDETVRKLRAAGIENLLALRGDYPMGEMFQVAEDFRYASQLIAHIRALPGGDALCIGAACYPEGHVESESQCADLINLKHKVDMGVDFLTTQMFFDNNKFYQFLYHIREIGIQVPIVAGIMPVTSPKQILRSQQLSGAAIPPRLQAIADRFGDKPAAMRQAGIVFATEQILNLLTQGVEHIHIYTMNKPDVAAEIMQNLSEVLTPRDESKPG